MVQWMNQAGGNPWGNQNTQRYGNDAVLVQDLTGAELLSATQAAIWHYTNNEDFKIVLERFVISFVVAEQQAKSTSNKEGYIPASAISFSTYSGSLSELIRITSPIFPLSISFAAALLESSVFSDMKLSRRIPASVSVTIYSSISAPFRQKERTARASSP